ncbi:hypothetical protein AB0C02_00340 [Micromonospora sp. NPDC048999]|uniref:hypothetical protein n=1 Tax=Micromonospora sp. NPDC048999 TaxID=3155391 RepID=UPI0033EE697A
MRQSTTLTAVLTGLLLAVVAAGPAYAADLGTLTITPTSGSVGSGVDDATPMFTSATTSAACPTGYGTNAVAKVGPVGGPYHLLNKVGSDNDYDAGAFSLGTNRSMAKALGAVPANGNFEIVIQCSGELLGDHPNYFRAPITVADGTWSASTQPVPPGGSSGSMTLRVEVAPAPGGSGSPTPSTGPTDGSDGPDSPGGGPLPVTGLAIGAVVAAGLLLVGVGAVLRATARRRRADLVG